MTINQTSHLRYDLWYHLVWGTKYRKQIWIDSHTRDRVKEIFRTIASHYDIILGEAECLPDHIHLTASAPPRIAPARIVQILKSTSTKLLFEEFPWLKKHYWGGEVWAGGYFVRSLGVGITKEQIDKYIEEQSSEN
ncbi:MAG: IS200/IS605 family transposase [Candidatus Moranbacteria bacterium]|nr:IS200/IS605 family transposase [Candidatus Moranbacteria bacterium]